MKAEIQLKDETKIFTMAYNHPSYKVGDKVKVKYAYAEELCFLIK